MGHSLQWLGVDPISLREAKIRYVNFRGGGGGRFCPPEISRTYGGISTQKTSFDAPLRELPDYAEKMDFD